MIAVLLVLASATAVDDLRARFDALKCEEVLDIASSIERDDAASADDKREARFRRGYCLVLIGNVGEAGALFQSIFADDIDAVVPFAMEQRVQYLVDIARSDVKAMRDAEAAEARRKLVERITLHARPPDELKGGTRAFFHVTLDDPDGVVRSLRVDFRKQGEPEFYALPVKKQIDGVWRGEVPGSYTKSAQGTRLEWFITASDAQGERLTTFGSREAPKVLRILPGSVIAEDLRANERMGHGTRALAGLVVAPVVTAIGMFVGGVVGYGGVLIDQQLEPEAGLPLREVRDGVLVQNTPDQPFTFFGVIIGSAAGGIAANATVTFTLLDGSDALWSTAAVAIPLAGGLVSGVLVLALASPSEFITLGHASAIATAAGAIGMVGTAVATTVFVLNDPPQE